MEESKEGKSLAFGPLIQLAYRNQYIATHTALEIQRGPVQVLRRVPVVPLALDEEDQHR